VKRHTRSTPLQDRLAYGRAGPALTLHASRRHAAWSIGHAALLSYLTSPLRARLGRRSAIECLDARVRNVRQAFVRPLSGSRRTHATRRSEAYTVDGSRQDIRSRVMAAEARVRAILWLRLARAKDATLSADSWVQLVAEHLQRDGRALNRRRLLHTGIQVAPTLHRRLHIQVQRHRLHSLLLHATLWCGGSNESPEVRDEHSWLLHDHSWGLGWWWHRYRCLFPPRQVEEARCDGGHVGQ